MLNGDLCYANIPPNNRFQPRVWRDFGNNCQGSAANRPWMPCPGNHEVEFYNGPQGFTSYLTRYTLPGNGVPGFGGHWYSFRVGSVFFISLDMAVPCSPTVGVTSGSGCGKPQAAVRAARVPQGPCCRGQRGDDASDQVTSADSKPLAAT
jgi:alkaline phosphatase D